MKIVSTFVARRPWATVLVCLIGGPIVGMLYLGKGRNALIYFLVSLLMLATTVAVILWGWLPMAPGSAGFLLPLPVQIVGMVHGYSIAKRISGEKPETWFARWYMVAGLMVLLQLAAPAFRTFLWDPFSIPSGSMLPTLEVGDYIWVSRFAYGKSWFSEGTAKPELGGIVIYKRALDNVAFVRRIVGLPGDRVQYLGGRLYINGILVDREAFGSVDGMARYLETLPNGRQHHILESSDKGGADNTQVYTVPDGHYFGLGDNRDRSSDSRFSNVGFIPYKNIVGRFEVVFWNSGRRDLMFEERP